MKGQRPGPLDDGGSSREGPLTIAASTPARARRGRGAGDRAGVDGSAAGRVDRGELHLDHLFEQRPEEDQRIATQPLTAKTTTTSRLTNNNPNVNFRFLYDIIVSFNWGFALLLRPATRIAGASFPVRFLVRFVHSFLVAIRSPDF